MTAPVETNIKRVAGFLPKASLTMLPGAAHYTFLDICVPAAVDRLAIYCKVPEFTAMRSMRRRSNVRGPSLFTCWATTPGNNASFEGHLSVAALIDELANLLECSEVGHSLGGF